VKRRELSTLPPWLPAVAVAVRVVVAAAAAVLRRMRATRKWRCVATKMLFSPKPPP
jgi:hypothetical protein